MRRPTFLVGLLVLALAGCATYSEGLNRGQRLYEENEFENALAIWRMLEIDMDSLSLNDQARYAYLRGMTDYRLGFREDSRHWLAVSKAIEQEHPGGLRPDWKSRIEEALNDLNRDVFGGSEELSRNEAAAAEHGDAPEGAPAEGAPAEGEPPAAPAPGPTP
jgi:hypothetical protein